MMQSLPGFRDFLPDDCAARNYIFARWREVARRYGFNEWDGPVLEPTDLYRKKSGAEIVDQLFNFTDKGEREVSMRPELTPTLARVVAAHERAFKKPLKWFSIGQFFRYEKQQRGRLREHYQLNCDIIGESDFAAEMGLIVIAVPLLVHTVNVIGAKFLWPEAAFDTPGETVARAGVALVPVPILRR